MIRKEGNLVKMSLVFPSYYGEYGEYKHAAKRLSTFPPLNLCIVAAMAEQAGWQVQLIDAQIEQLDNLSVIQAVENFQPDLIGLTSTTPFFHNAAKFAHMAKERFNVPIMMGGTHVSICREKTFDDCNVLDYLVIGECETTFPKFITNFADGNRFPNVPGIIMRNNGKTIYHGDVHPLSDLDKCPLPARHLLQNSKYVLGSLKGLKQYTTFQFSRGCPYSCVFCAADLHGKSFRQRSVENVIEELEIVVNKFGTKHIYFVDDVLTLNKKYIYSLCDEIEKHNLHFTFEGSTRADLWDEALVKRLKECGLIRISFGLETADLKIREIIKKNVPLESYIEANKLSNRLGIETTNSVIIGLPGETIDSIKRTVDFLCKARDLLHITLNIAIPYPGTELLKMAEDGQHGLEILERDFSRYQRYGSSVMSVNGISPKELVSLQRKALIRIYSCWWRIIPLLKRFGLKTVVLTAINVVWELIKSMKKLSGKQTK